MKIRAKAKALNSSTVIYAWGLAMVVCLFLLIKNNIPEKVPTRLIEMLGADSKVESISIHGTYLIDNLGNTSEKVISIITNKAEIDQLLSELNNYEFKYIDDMKLPKVKMSKDNGVLQGLTFALRVNNSEYDQFSATVHLYLPQNYVYVDVTKEFIGYGGKIVYGGKSTDEKLINHLKTQVLNK